jgi:hypothetical protein
MAVTSCFVSYRNQSLFSLSRFFSFVSFCLYRFMPSISMLSCFILFNIILQFFFSRYIFTFVGCNWLKVFDYFTSSGLGRLFLRFLRFFWSWMKSLYSMVIDWRRDEGRNTAQHYSEHYTTHTGWCKTHHTERISRGKGRCNTTLLPSSSSYPFSEYDTIKRNKNITSHTTTQHLTIQSNWTLSISQLIEQCNVMQYI